MIKRIKRGVLSIEPNETTFDVDYVGRWQSGAGKTLSMVVQNASPHESKTIRNFKLAGFSLLLIIGLLIALIRPAVALELIYDSGQHGPAAPFYEQIETVERGVRRAFENSEAMEVPSTLIEPITIENYFPIDTNMQPGEAVQITVDGLQVPMFVIGMDLNSLSWLDRYFNDLVEMGANGFVVAGDDPVEYLRVRKLAKSFGMQLEIAPGNALSADYGILTYPVLMIPLKN